MRAFSQTLRPDVALMALYLLAGLPLQWWAYFLGAIPFMNYGPPPWPNFPAYVLAGPLAAYLFWRRSPRARLATYTFLTFDILRSARLAHWLPLVVDIAIILYLQTPTMRRLYPSMWSRRKALWRPWARG
ncbi:MAG: hypothetical protein HYU29_00960 [Chloroflexi bacterium]|nr:hypothetical protein [Chloroflexota bacterium]